MKTEIEIGKGNPTEKGSTSEKGSISERGSKSDVITEEIDVLTPTQGVATSREGEGKDHLLLMAGIWERGGIGRTMRDLTHMARQKETTEGSPFINMTLVN